MREHQWMKVFIVARLFCPAGLSSSTLSRRYRAIQRRAKCLRLCMIWSSFFFEVVCRWVCVVCWVGFSYLPFHPIAFYRSLEAFLRHTHHNLALLLLWGVRYEVYHPYRKR